MGTKTLDRRVSRGLWVALATGLLSAAALAGQDATLGTPHDHRSAATSAHGASCPMMGGNDQSMGRTGTMNGMGMRSMMGTMRGMGPMMGMGRMRMAHRMGRMMGMNGMGMGMGRMMNMGAGMRPMSCPSTNGARP